MLITSGVFPLRPLRVALDLRGAYGLLRSFLGNAFTKAGMRLPSCNGVRAGSFVLSEPLAALPTPGPSNARDLLDPFVTLPMPGPSNVLLLPLVLPISASPSVFSISMQGLPA